MSCTYSVGRVPVSHRVTNYEPSGVKVTLYLGLTKRKETDYDAFQKVPLGLGMSRGGAHVWVYSYCDVF